MIIQSARAAFANLFRREARFLLLKSVALTLALAALLWMALSALMVAYVEPAIEAGVGTVPNSLSFLPVVAEILAGFGIAMGIAFFMPSMTAAMAGLFLDDVAEGIERRDYAGDPSGRALGLVPSLLQSGKTLLLVLVLNLIALPLILLPFINAGIFLILNGYLLGREYFEFAAMRFRSADEARRLREANQGRVTLAGLLIALSLAIPIVNLATPLFAAGLMVHLHKRISREML